MASRCVLLLACLFAFVAHAQEINPARGYPDAAALRQSSPGLIVRFRDDADVVRDLASEQPARNLSARMGVNLTAVRPLVRSRRVYALRLDPSESVDSIARTIERLRANPDVEYVEQSARRYLHRVPNDPLFAQQWYLQNLVEAPSSLNVESAWDVTQGASGLVIAVLDTGVLYDHPDLMHLADGGRLLPGYDFIADAANANDGNGRDGDPSDPGDWLSSNEATGIFTGCSVGPSSWHGTRVAGLVGAWSDNLEGIAGVSGVGGILPVRVSGRCGADDSDILDAMLWAGGMEVDGVPSNPFPARVLNLSLGSPGPCPNSYQDAIDVLAARGVLVVVSAGNEGNSVAAPANCRGVVAVAGLRHAGTKVGYSSLGPEITIGAPAGNCVNPGGACLYSIDTTTNTGTMQPAAHTYTDSIDFNVGTSFSAPLVAGVAGLMFAVNGSLTPPQVIERLGEGAKLPFPRSSDATVPDCHVPISPFDLQLTECNCTTGTCGAGMLNAPGAIDAALRPVVAISAPSVASAGDVATLSAVGSAAACGHDVSGFSWSVVADTTGGFGFTQRSPAEIEFVVPSTGSAVLEVIVTDNAGRADATTVTISPTSVSTVAPAILQPACLLDDLAGRITFEVTVAPTAATVATGASLSFAASISNTTADAVSWEIDGVPGGNAIVGTIDASGHYAAPSAVPDPAQVTVTAVSIADAQLSASAVVTVVAAADPGGNGGTGTPPRNTGGGGGGAPDLPTLACLVVLLLFRYQRNRKGVLS